MSGAKSSVCIAAAQCSCTHVVLWQVKVAMQLDKCLVVTV